MIIVQNTNATTYDKFGVTQTNKATLVCGTQTVTTTAKVDCVNKFFVKNSAAPKGEKAGYNPADNTFWWSIHINKENRPITGATVTDLLPKGTEYVGYQLYTAKTGSDNAETKVEDSQIPAELGPVVTKTDDGTQVVFNFGDMMKDGAGYVLYVQTRVDTDTALDADGTASFNNRAWLDGSQNGTQLHSYDYEDQKVTTKTMTKEGKQTVIDGKYVYELTWRIEVNRNGKATGYSTPTLTDILPEGTTLQDNGVVIYQYKEDYNSITADLAQTDLKDAWKYDKSTNTFTFQLPLAEGSTDTDLRYHAYRIMLKADLSPAVGGTEITNKAELTAEQKEIGSGSADSKVFYFGASGDAKWGTKPPEGTRSLTVTKKSTDSEQVLPGAEFKVEYRLKGEEEFKLFSSASVTTGEDGTLTIMALPQQTVEVRLTELTPPEGYQLPENPVTVVELTGDTNQVTILNQPTPDPGPRPDPDPDPDPDPTPTPIPDEEVPTTSIPDEGTPTTEAPEVNEPVTELPDEEVPLADVPATGDGSAWWLLASGLSGLGLVWLTLKDRKRREEEQ
jgi:LPXTG-motif cell wall-anchored protein